MGQKTHGTESITLASSQELGDGGLLAMLVGPNQLSDIAAQIGLGGDDSKLVQRAIDRKQFTGVVGTDHLVQLGGGREVLLVGAGYAEDDGWRAHQNDAAAVLDAVGNAVQAARGLTDIQMLRLIGEVDPRHAALVARGIVLANHVRAGTGIKPCPEGKGALEQVDIHLLPNTSAIQEEVRFGSTVGRWQSWGRTLVDQDCAVVKPQVLINAGVTAARDLGLQVTIDYLDTPALRARGYYLSLAVNRASHLPAAGLVLEYRACPDSTFFIDLVGKGVTKDTGGEALKPASGSVEMHMDMAGAAVSMAIFFAAVELGLAVNLRCRVIGVRNMVGPRGYSNGDRVVSRILGGKSVHIVNTDAEGRLVLAEQIAAARQAGSGLVITYATLTGAACAALKEMTAAFGSPPGLARQYTRLALKAADPAWRMPFLKNSLRELLDDANGADIANSAKGKLGGATRAAEFLAWAAEDTPLLHLDIAPQMENGPKTKGWRCAGGEVPQVSPSVRLLKAIAEAGQEEWARSTLGWTPQA